MIVVDAGSGKTNPSPNDIFWRNDAYPDAASTLSFEHKPLVSIKDSCIVVLDANVLLQPYEVDSTEAVNEIEKVYRLLAQQGRLVVPGQSVREYLSHRPKKIVSVIAKLNGAIERLKKVSLDRIPLLENDPSFLELRKTFKDVRSEVGRAIEGLQKEIDNLTLKIGGDRISALYREVLSASVADPVYTDDEKNAIVVEVERRARLELAPGYKDAGKSDKGVGDYLIWQTILLEGKKRNADCLFITMETKPDWWVKQSNAFQPRPELIEEYRRETNGKSLWLAPLSDALDAFAASKQVVDEVKEAETKSIAAVDTFASNEADYSSVIQSLRHRIEAANSNVENSSTLEKFERSKGLRDPSNRTRHWMIANAHKRLKENAEREREQALKELAQLDLLIGLNLSSDDVEDPNPIV